MAEQEHAEGYCDRCGHRGHAGAKCPTVQPYLFKNHDRTTKPAVARVSSEVSGALRTPGGTRGATGST
jgi:hypothetical protein